MKTPILAFVILASAVIGGGVVYAILGHKPASVPTVAATPAPADATPASTQKVITEGMQPAPRPAPPSAPPVIVIPASAVVTVTNDTNSAAAELHKKVDELLDPHIPAARKHELFQELAKASQLPQAIADLQQRAQADPNNPEIPTTIGEAQINELRGLYESGSGDQNQIAILAMQADENFNAALKIDPQNYEAQLVKSISMTFWPADPTRDPQVVQSLSSLIDQQESMPANPEFAQTYLYLGNEYAKMGQTAQAQATWQLGLQKYPNSTELQQKVNGH